MSKKTAKKNRSLQAVTKRIKIIGDSILKHLSFIKNFKKC